METAVQLARWYTGKPFILVPYGDYHGRTPGTMGLTGKATMWSYYYPIPPIDTAISYFPYPYCYRCPYDKEYPQCDIYCIKFLDFYFKSNQTPFMDVRKGISNVAAIIIEPMQGSGGYIIPPDNYLVRLQELCRKYDILLIIDEIQTGMGRTGKMWACEHWNVEPDVICMSKAMAAGLPCGACVTRKEIMNWDPGAHENTLGGNPIVIAAALAVLRVIFKERLIENAREMGEYLMKRLKEIQQNNEIIGDVRGKGLMIGVELVKDKKTKTPARKERNELIMEAFKRGLLLLGAGESSLRLAPPLIINKQQIDTGLEIMEESLKAIQGM